MFEIGTSYGTALLSVGGATILDEREVKIRELAEQIADLKRRMPAHSVKPAMISHLEELEEELERLKKED